MSPQYLLVLLQKIINLCTRDAKLIFVAINLLWYLTSTEGNSNDFKWLHTPNPVKGMYFTDVKLVWKYEFKGVINKIDISRTKTKLEKEHVALWTHDGGSKPNRLISTDVIIDHQEEEGSIILTLEMAYTMDFNKLYYCQAYLNNATDNVQNTEKELQSYKLEYRPVTKVIEGRPGEDVKLVWNYKYHLPVKGLVFYNNRNIKTDMIAWMRGVDRYVEKEYENRLTFEEPLNKGQVEITLTILNTTVDDYNYTYYSQAIGLGGETKLSEIYLSAEKEKYVSKSNRDIQLSSASDLSKYNKWLVFFRVLVKVVIQRIV